MHNFPLQLPKSWVWMLAVGAVLYSSAAARAQGNYEIQVYGADTVEPKSTMVEIHSNYTLDGQKYQVDGVYPTNHQLHETLEITQGLTSWSEVGFYVFTSTQRRAWCAVGGRPYSSPRPCA